MPPWAGGPGAAPPPPPLPARSCSPFSRSQDLWKYSRPALPTSPLKEGMDLNPTNELQKNYGFLPMPFPAPQALRLGGGGGHTRTRPTERGMNRCELISKAKAAISVCCCEPTSPPPASPSPHHQIIAKYLLMFFFHPSKRWSSACSSAPFWVCCVWRQCSGSELSEVKGGHKGRRRARPCGPAGGLPPSPQTCRPAAGESGGDPPAGEAGPPVPLSPRCPGAAPYPPSRPGEEREGKGCDPHVRPSVRPSGTRLLYVQGARGGRRGDSFAPPD